MRVSHSANRLVTSDTPYSLQSISQTYFSHLCAVVFSPYTLEKASLIMGCVKKLTQQAALDNDYNAAYAANVLSDLAKEVVDDLTFGQESGQGSTPS
ncbi:DUF3077 domain-containing protein [Pseudomonas sp. X10]